MSEEKALADAMHILTGKIMKETPEIFSVLEAVKRGDLGQAEGMEQLMELMIQQPDLEVKLAKASSQVISSLVGYSDEEKENFAAMAGGFVSRGGKGGLKVDPLYMAALIERGQFDGDIPEARTGPLPEDTLPAVSVQTKETNPVAIGKMMSTASKSLKKKIDKHEDRRQKELENFQQELLGGSETALMAKHSAALAKFGTDMSHPAALDMLKWGSEETDLPEYPRGSIPAPIKKRTPRGGALLKLEKEEEQKLSWEVLSTTQGRRSVSGVLMNILLKELKKKGFKITGRELTKDVPEGQILASYDWSLGIGGEASLQSSFDFVGLTARALIAGLVKKFETEIPKGPLFLEVGPLNELAKREVGWAARIIGENKALE